MKRVWLVLHAQSDAVFTATASTLGGHASLSYVPGASLLGWAAGRLYAKLGAQDAFTAFHSGELRFGDGWPLTHTNAPAFPAPLCWHERKRERGGLRQAGRQCQARPANIRNYQFQHDRFADQPEVLKNAFVAGDGSAYRSARGWRGKTAIESGGRRAEQSQFFGYDHSKAGTRYAALIEANPDVAVFDQVVDAFRRADGPLSLGRSKASEFGGQFRVEIVGSETVPWEKMAPSGDLLTIWCLSDLALENETTGAPALVPSPMHFGLDRAGYAFDASRSFVATRRYAAWNKKLARPDVERPVITAGSVLAFRPPSDDRMPDALLIKELADRGTFGLYRECGLGRVWINPPCLASSVPEFASRSIDFARKHDQPTLWPERLRTPSGEDLPFGVGLRGWAEGVLAGVRSRRGTDELAEQWFREIQGILDALAVVGEPLPAPAQWSAVIAACDTVARSDDSSPAALLRKLITDSKAPCRDGPWVAQAPGVSTLRDWINGALAGERAPQEPAQVLGLVGSRHAKRAQQARESRS